MSGSDPVILFAREHGARFAPCNNLVVRWLRQHNVENVPSDSECRRLWKEYGGPEGLVLAAERMGLVEHDPQPGDVAIISQGEGVEPILGLVAHNGFVVVRSFGVLAVGKPQIIRSWGMPCQKSSNG